MRFPPRFFEEEALLYLEAIYIAPADAPRQLLFD
jgi:hypothetical protein